LLTLYYQFPAAEKDRDNGQDSQQSASILRWTLIHLITGIKAFGLPKTGLRKKTREFYATLSLDGQVKKTKVAPEGNAPIWDDTFEL